MTHHFESIKLDSKDKFQYIIETIKKPTALGRLLKIKEKRYEFIGSGTIWRDLNGFKRCDSHMNMFLADCVAYAKYNELI
jgi:hypothetical protein